jgi:hypothetical protein
MVRPRENKLNASARAFRVLMEQAACETYEDAAELLGVPVRTIRGWANDRPVPEPIKRLLRIFAIYRIDLKRIK